MCLGKHVLDYDVGFQVTYLKLFLSIGQRYVWMLPSMHGFAGVGGFAFPPVVKEEVMQKTAACGGAVVEAKGLRYCVGDVGDADDMVVDMVRVMKKLFELAKLLILENVINKMNILLTLRSGQQKGYSSDTDHRTVQVICHQ